MKTISYMRRRVMLGVSVLFVILALYILQESYNFQRINQFDSAIDMAGLQRMLINQSALLILEIHTTNDQKLKNELRKKLIGNYNIFVGNLDALVGKNNTYNSLITGPMKNFYAKNNYEYYKKIEKTLNYIRSFYQNKASSNISINDLNYHVFTATNILNNAVKSLNNAMDKEISSRILNQFIFLILYLIAIYIAYRLIYLPLEKRVIKRERKLHEQILKSMEQTEYAQDSFSRYKVIVDSSPVAIVVIDLATGLLIDCNKATSELFKMTKDQLLNNTPEKLSPFRQHNKKLSSAAASEEIAKTIKKTSNKFEWLHQDSQGKKINCIVNLTYMKTKKGEYILGVINNITEQDHRNIKRRTRPMLGFKSVESAKSTLAGYELINMLRKGKHIDAANQTVFEQFYALAG